jgi:hypothetical protein
MNLIHILKTYFSKTHSNIILLSSYVSNNLHLNDNLIERVNQFTCPKSINDKSGGIETDVVTRTQKACIAFGALLKIWNSRAYSIGTKLRLFNSNVKSVLLHGCKRWKASKTTTKQLQVFISKCLRRILYIFLPVHISNNDLWTRTNEVRIYLEIRRRKWG